jgi:hypothetical protein
LHGGPIAADPNLSGAPGVKGVTSQIGGPYSSFTRFERTESQRLDLSHGAQSRGFTTISHVSSQEEGAMKRILTVILSLVFVWSVVGTVAPVSAQPADQRSKQIAKYGDWRVVQKRGNYAIVGSGKTGSYKVCSAVFFGQNAQLEFEVKNDQAWGVYIGKKGWDYQPHRAKLTLKAGRKSIRLMGVYGYSMISAASHDLAAGQRIPLSTLKSLVAQQANISVLDKSGRNLATFAATGGDLGQALARAQKC